MIKRSVLQQKVAIYNVYVPNDRASSYKKLTLIEM